jgi:hypothetical protein
MTMIGAVLAMIMNMASASVLPLALPIAPDVVTKEDMRRWKQQRKALCRKGARLRHAPQRIVLSTEFNGNDRNRLADLYWTGEDCRKDPVKAIALLDLIVGTNPAAPIDLNALQGLIAYHSEYDPQKSSSRIMGLKRMLWMHGDFSGDDTELGWDDMGKRAFVLSDLIWAWSEDSEAKGWRINYTIILIKMQALLDPTSLRFDFEKGVTYAIREHNVDHMYAAAMMLEEGKLVPRNMARAADLLWRSRSHSQAHALLVKRTTPLLDDPDAAVRAKAFADMKDLATQHTPTGVAASDAMIIAFSKQLKTAVAGDALNAQQELNTLVLKGSTKAKAVLIPHITNQLRSGTVEQQNAARISLSTILRSGDKSVQPVLDEDIKRANGILAEQIKKTGGLIDLKTNEALQFSMTDDDYLTRAMRNEENGLVSVTVILGPDGRPIKVEQATGASPTLASEVANRALRRARIKPARRKEFEGRYVRVRLPDVFFRLAACNAGDVLAEPPANAIVVTSICREIIR